MSCRSWGTVKKVLVGLQRIGIVGLRQAFEEADESGLAERDEILDLVMGRLSEENYVPASEIEVYRRAVWREYLRRIGGDIRGFYSEVEVAVRGEVGEERDRFVDTLVSVFGDFELEPVPVFLPPSTEGRNPALLIEGEVIVQGSQTRGAFKAALKKSISHW